MARRKTKRPISESWIPAEAMLPDSIEEIEAGKPDRSARVASDLQSPPMIQRELFTYRPASWELPFIAPMTTTAATPATNSPANFGE